MGLNNKLFILLKAATCISIFVAIGYVVLPEGFNFEVWRGLKGNEVHYHYHYYHYDVPDSGDIAGDENSENIAKSKRLGGPETMAANNNMVVNDNVITDRVNAENVITDNLIDNNMIPDTAIVDDTVVDNTGDDKNVFVGKMVVDDTFANNGAVDNAVADNVIADNVFADNVIPNNPDIDNPVIDSPADNAPVADSAVAEKASVPKASKTTTVEQEAEALLKTRWPECQDKNLDVFACKELVDQEIKALSAGNDKKEGKKLPTDSVIVYRRTKDDPMYNAVVIPMDDDDIVQGRRGDGLVFYDFPWSGSGMEATMDARSAAAKKIGPSEWTLSMPFQEDVKNPDGSPRELEYVGGGDYNLYAVSSFDGYQKLVTELSKPTSVPPEGDRKIGPWNCSGMVGTDCCRMIQHEVIDMDNRGNAIGCWMSYKKGTNKLKESRTWKKIQIVARRDMTVAETPKVG